MTRVRQLNNPQYTLLENIGHEIENIDFIFFATSQTDQVRPQVGESQTMYWLTEAQVRAHQNIKEHIKLMALEALYVMRKEDKDF